MIRRHFHQVDEASLQTDVMRFMAIVALCLVAILAMVRNVDGPAPTESTASKLIPDLEIPEQVDPEPVPVRQSQKRFVQAPDFEQPKPTLAEPAPRELDNSESDNTRTVTPEPVFPKPAESQIKEFVVRRTRPVRYKPLPEPEFELAASQATIELPVQEAEVPEPLAPLPAPLDSPQQPLTETAGRDDTEGLSLRFSSESDFLRLVARRKVAVYAFNSTSFLELDHNYRFQDVNPPSQVYELESSTIPSHMKAALPESHDGELLKWAVGLPSRVEKQIQDYLNQVDSGQLLIDRFEEVRHVAAR